MQLNTTGNSTEEQLLYPFTVLPLCFNKEVGQYIEFQTAQQTAPCWMLLIWESLFAVAVTQYASNTL